ncbi:MAG: hypothetical protein JNM56_38095 [Planctomycetia bacterium]|nr:hypothetical protein [Planctomycetia bacterium]
MKRPVSRVSAAIFATALALACWLALGTQAQDGAAKKAEKPAAAPDTAPIEQMIAELKTIGELVKQLDSDKFETRQRASDRLVELGAPVRVPLRRMLANNPSLEMAARIESILQEVAKRETKGGVSGKELRARLRTPITLPNGIEASTPLKDALEFLAEQAGVQIFIDQNAFAAIGVQQAGEQPVQLAKLKGVPLGRVLHLLLAQIKGEVYHGDWLVRTEVIEATTSYHTLAEALGGPLAEHFDAEGKELLRTGTPRILKLVHADFERKPLAEAVRELTETVDVSVVIDPRIGDKGKTPVTATFNNVCVDTAVELLADLGDLRAVQVDRVFYLTTKENAKAFEAGRKPPRRIERPGMGGGLLPPPM